MTVLVFIFILYYASEKIRIWFHREDTQYSTYVREGIYTDKDFFSQRDTNFYVAFGFLGANEEDSGSLKGHLEWVVNMNYRVTLPSGLITQE